MQATRLKCYPGGPIRRWSVPRRRSRAATPDRPAAGNLSRLFIQDQIKKTYRAEVLGDITRVGGIRQINQPIDGKPALTEITHIWPRQQGKTSLLELVLHTGRTHQIRRHLADVGFPIMGDPKYGRRNSHPGGLQLVAWAIDWRCPACNGPLKGLNPTHCTACGVPFRD